MADSVRVDPAALAGAAGQAGAVAHAAIPHADQVAPCASDHVSVAASSRFGAQVSLARRYTEIANSVARRYGVMLQSSAAAYGDQEAASAATLGSGGGGAVPIPTPVPSADVDAVAALLSGGGVSSPAGEVPVAPRDIARLIETGRGGVGVAAWQAVERSLRLEAAALEQAVEQLGAAIVATEASWESGSAPAATARLRTLQGWYEGHARYVGGLAQQASSHIGNFHRASTDIPTYREVVEGERELDTAVRANIAAKGMRREAVVHAQVKVAGLYQASTAGFSSYTFAESVPGPGPGAPIPPPGTSAGSPDVQRANGPGGAPVTKPDPSPASAPREPVQQGPGPGESLLSGGPTWPPADVDPAAVGSPLLETVTGAGAGAVPQLLPGILGGVVGGLGGVMGGLAGSGAKALQGVQQAAAPMMSGLGQHPGGGSPSGGESPPETPESLGEPAGADGGGGGGGGGGETAPASDGGAMGAPAPLMAAPEAAAPAAAASAPAAPAATSAGPAPAVGAMGPMMPPMGGRGGASGGPQNKQLYPDRVLKVVTPPNSEPVKNRYEGRNKDNDRGRDKPRG